MPRAILPHALLAIVVLGLTATVAHASGDMSAEEFGRRLERAAELNVTEPWPRSQAILDQLRGHLDIATPEQYAEYRLLESRNQALNGHVDEALETIDALLERKLTPKQKIRAHTRGANVGHIARRFEKTYSHLNEALQMLEDPALRSEGDEVYSLAAYMYTLVGQLDQAVRFGQLAVRLASDAGKPRKECSARQRLAFVYKVRDEFEHSRRLYNQAIALCEQAGDQLLAAISRYGLADLLGAFDRPDRAERLFATALDQLERLEYRPGLAEARLYAARLAHQRGQGDRVIELLEPALDQLRRDRNWEYFAEAERMLAEVARSRGQYDRAMQHFERFVRAREDHLSLARDRQTAFLEVQFDMRHTEQQLKLLREQQRVRALEAESARQARNFRWVLYTLTAGLVVVLVFLLMHALRERRRFRNLSQRDGLTALSNHTRFFELTERMLALAEQKRQPFALIVADIDHFKQVNDTHGHLAGDEILRRVGARLREHFGADGVIGRIGGEEFGIALPGDRIGDLRARIDRLRESLLRIRDDDLQVRVTMSFGVARWRGPGESPGALRERADQALYQAKHAGRDQLVYADDPL